MKANDVKVAVSHYLDLVVNGRGSERESTEALVVALDMLAWIQNLIEQAESDHRLVSPDHEFDKMRALIVAQFPGFGQYGLPVEITDQNGTAPAEKGDAVDDLARIACHLYEVAWRFQNTSEGDAVAAFVRSYHEAWRRHLRALQWYLEMRRDDSN